MKFAYRRASGDVTMVVRVNTMDTKGKNNIPVGSLDQFYIKLTI